MSINRILITTVLLIYIFLSSPAASAQCKQADDNCVLTGQWHISTALGAGVLTNPLHGGENIPLVVLPYIHYYGEQFFIENNVIGYSLLQSEDVILSVISQLNREKSFFTQWQAKHLFIPTFSDTVNLQPEKEYVNQNEIKKRKWALDGGVQVNWFISDTIELKAQLLHDINNVYQGFNSQLRLDKFISLSNNTRVNAAIGLNWQSQKLSNYYYGISPSDKVAVRSLYQAKSGSNPFISLNIRHQLSQHWQAQFFIKREFLGSHISNSPLIQESNISSAFVGVVYAF
ncbi:MipA/OmpV family protein [Thalassotalea sp. G2M2-11]|uniref:MipA/OmpV family protein n=1 Tax=Thalassotalea sp. G2M2-11 TaxID=2787627 RepID=UPI0019D2B979|nr:MipA/OmpV family protein [Thalassotalea sp. G2M2-11]